MKYTGKEIAIIGMVGKFINLNNIDELWLKLIDKGVVIKAKKDLETGFLSYNSSLKGKDEFDPVFFGYSKSEASVMDPQIRIFHEYTWKALENANVIPSSENKIGIFSSASDNIYWKLFTLYKNNLGTNYKLLDSSLSDEKFISSLIAYKLNLTGPAVYIDTACSSSLVAVHQASRSLLMKECNIAIAGGISVISKERKGHFYIDGQIFSKDGYCRAFDEKASGTIPGEGLGIVVLKRLSDAIKDKDYIYSVIKGSAINSDGNRKVGYTAPSIAGQVECIESAINFSQVPKNSISYIETHGTGTNLGDSVEFEALKQVFSNTEKINCNLGAIKNTLGHLDVAAGITGLIKTSLSLSKKQIPPTLNFSNPNPSLGMSETSFSVGKENQKWERKNDNPLRAGISSFGIGGTNVHIVLEEYNNVISEKQESIQLYPFSAKTQSSLKNIISSVNDYQLKTNFSSQNIAYSLAIGRTKFQHREVHIGSKIAEPLKKIKSSSYKTNNNEPVFMFPGQGILYSKMVKYLFDNDSFFKKQIEKGISLISDSYKDENLLKIMFETENYNFNKKTISQPIAFIIQHALAQRLINMGVVPKRMIGHSLGEYVAATISEIFSYHDALKILIYRSKLMSLTESGEMITVNISEEGFKKLKFNSVDIAAINSKDLIVLSGNTSEISNCKVYLKKQNISYLNLTTSHAFHSKMMDDILIDFKKFISNIPKSHPKIPFISSLTGDFITNEEAVSNSYWVKHLRQPVQFSKGILNLKDYPHSFFLEMGPGVLTTLAKRNFIKENHLPPIFQTIKNQKNSTKNEKEIDLTFLSELWVNGVDINWNKYYEQKEVSKIPLPTYVFDKYKFFSNFDMNNIDIENTLTNKLDQIDINKKLQYEQIEIKRPEGTELFEESKTKTESILVDAWKEIFGYDKISVKDNFFDFGGDSIKALKLCNRIRDDMNINIKIDLIYNNPTIKLLAKSCDLIKVPSSIKTKENNIII